MSSLSYHQYLNEELIHGNRYEAIFDLDLRSNARFLLRHGGCVIITLATCTGDLKIRKSAFHKEIHEGCLGFS